MSEAGPAAVTEDTLLGGRVKLRQPVRGHRAGTDAVLLAGLAEARPGDLVVDLGSATGAVGLMLAARMPEVRLVLVERDPDLAALAAENLALNERPGGQDRICCADAFADGEAWRAAGGPIGEVDLVITNPPFFGEPSHRASPDPGRRAAHVLDGGTLADWLGRSARMLKPKGRLCLIHRADAIGACLAALAPGFGSLTIRPIHPRAEAAANRVLIAAIKGGRGVTALLPPLVLHRPDGEFTPEAKALHRPGHAPQASC